MSEPMRLKARVSAPIAVVHRALTSADAMRLWLAEHAEVDLPERYEFWGRYTPEGDKPHQRPLHVDDHTVRFAWLIDGEDTTVDIGLEAEDPQSTLISLSQTHFPDWQELLAGKSVRGVLHTFWSLAIANLIDHLEGRPLTPMCDFTSTEMRESVEIDAPRDAVYDSLINPEKFRRWFGVNVEIEPYVGGRFAMGGFDFDETPAKIIELVPGRRLAMDWQGMVAAWELEDTRGRTRLTFVQSGFDPEQPPYDAWMGWLSGIAELRRFHEVPDWRPVWLNVSTPGMPEGLMAND